MNDQLDLLQDLDELLPDVGPCDSTRFEIYRLLRGAQVLAAEPGGRENLDAWRGLAWVFTPEVAELMVGGAVGPNFYRAVGKTARHVADGYPMGSRQWATFERELETLVAVAARLNAGLVAA